jgi:hypothetical protein
MLMLTYLKHDRINSIGRLQLFLFCIKFVDDESRGIEVLVSLSATGKYSGVDLTLSSIFNENSQVCRIKALLSVTNKKAFMYR